MRVGLVGSLMLFIASAPAQNPPLKQFASAEAAAEAAINAAGKNDIVELNRIFGLNSKAILTSGDTRQDEQERAQFARAALARHRLEKDPMNRHRMILDIGPEDWPFPVPIVEVNGTWSFSSVQGELEVKARRIGANELDVIEVCAGYVEAQRQYAAFDRDGDGILEFATRLNSTPGKEDGIYGDQQPMIPKNLAEAELLTASGKAKPFHGYYFRVLKAQGPHAEGGAHGYFVQNRHMMGGFALVAWPAAYGLTGVRTFLVNQEGRVFEKDRHGAPPPTRYDPDSTWKQVD